MAKKSVFAESIGKEDVVYIGHQAESLLKNPAFDYAVKRIEEELFKAWKTSKPGDAEAREHIYYRMEGLAHIRLKLSGIITNMQLETKKQENKKKGD